MPPSKAASKRPADAATKWDPSVVLKPVKKLRAEMGPSAAAKKTLDDIGMSGVTKEVVAMDTRGVAAEIERIALEATLSIMRGEGFSYTMPARTSSNMVYVAELDRLVLRDKTLERVFANASSARKTAITTRVLQLILELCSKGIHVTKRDLFYTDVKLFKQQTESDDVLDDAACMVGCTRSSLNVVASEKGIVVGKLIFDDDGDTIDCTKMGVGGKAITPSIDRVTNLRGDAEFILLIEKDAAFMRLAEDRARPPPRPAVRCDASKRDASKPSVTRRDAAMGLGAALLGAFVAPTAANAVECTWAIGCMPGTEPGAPPRYTMPGPAYSPAEAAEERFRAKIRAEKEAEQSAFNKRMAAQEEAAAAKAAADAAAEAAAKAAAEAAAAQ